MDEHAELVHELRERLRGSEFYRWAGIELVDAAPGEAEIAFEAGPQHVNLQGLVHGGILATLADTAMGLAVKNGARTRAAPCDGAARRGVPHTGSPGRIVARGRTVKIGRQLGFAEAEVIDEGGRVLARARSTLSVTAARP